MKSYKCNANRFRNENARTCKKWGVSILEFNGRMDHVHLLPNMNPSIQPSKFINNLKTVSSRYMKKYYTVYLKQFYWGTNAMWSRA